MDTAIRLFKQERTTAKYLAIIIGGFFLVGLIFAIALPENINFNVMNAERFAHIHTVGDGYVWNVTAGMMGALAIASVIIGIVHAAVARTYLGAGAPRRSAYIMYVMFSVAWTLAATAVIALAWGISTLFEMPKIWGVSAASLALIPVTYISMYFVGLGISMLFVRFAWWKVIIGVVITVNLATLAPTGIAWLRTGEAIWELDTPSPGLSILLTLALGALGAVVAYLAHRNVPIRRS